MNILDCKTVQEVKEFCFNCMEESRTNPRPLSKDEDNNYKRIYNCPFSFNYLNPGPKNNYENFCSESVANHYKNDEYFYIRLAKVLSINRKQKLEKLLSHKG